MVGWFTAAYSSAVLLFLSFKNGSQPFYNKATHISIFPLSHAFIKAVSPPKVYAFKSIVWVYGVVPSSFYVGIPLSIKKSTADLLPTLAAMCNGVL